jgi:hypothetical protein
MMKLVSASLIRMVIASVLSFGAGAAAWAAPQKAAPATVPSGKVRYKQGKDVRFDNLLINGALQRPETLMVTGDAAHESSGILKLRKSFRDRMLADSGHELSESGENR